MHIARLNKATLDDAAAQIVAVLQQAALCCMTICAYVSTNVFSVSSSLIYSVLSVCSVTLLRNRGVVEDALVAQRAWGLRTHAQRGCPPGSQTASSNEAGAA